MTYKEDGTPVFDRAISSAPFREILKNLFSDGVLPNPSTNLQVTAGTGMQINVFAGFAICNGCLKLQELNTLMPIEAANTVNDRIDTLVLRLDDNDDVRACELYVVTGTPATTPSAPALTRSGSIWELGLANILVKANSTQISNANITDTRYDSARCGIISSISEFDTTTLYQQICADLEEFQDVNQAEFEAWFANIKGQLEGDVATNLQNQIGTLSNLSTTKKTDLVSAINEVAAKEVDVLDTKEEIQANTESGKVAGAKAVKEMFTEVNQSLGDISGFTNDTYNNLGAFLQYCVDNGYLPDVNATNLTLVNLASGSYLKIRNNNDGTATISGNISVSETIKNTTTIVSTSGIPVDFRPKSTVTFDAMQDTTARTITINTNGSITISALHSATSLAINYTYSLN